VHKIFFYTFLVLIGCSTPKVDFSNDEIIYQPIPMRIDISIISESSSDSLFSCKGFVVDSTTSENLIGTNIIIGSKRFIKSNSDGTFYIDNLQRKDTLLFKYIGYISKKVFVNDVFKNKSVW
jgi:hypothetical protein